MIYGYQKNSAFNHWCQSINCKKKIEKKLNHWKNASPEDLFLELLPYVVIIVIGLMGGSILVSFLSNYMAEDTAKSFVDLITLDVGFFFNKYLKYGLIYAIVVAGLIWEYKNGYYRFFIEF